MKKWTFDALVKARGNEKAQEKIARFRKTVDRALAELDADFNGYANPSYLDTGKKYLALVSDPKSSWPRKLWDREEQAAAQEILEMMGPMERALTALYRVPGADDVVSDEAPGEQES